MWKWRLQYTDYKADTKWYMVWFNGEYLGVAIIGINQNRFCSENKKQKIKMDKELNCLYTV